MEGRPRILAREEQRLQQFLQHEGGQADAIDRHGQCGRRCILGAELAAFEQDRDQRVRDYHKCDGRGDGQQQHELPRPRKRVARACLVARAQAA